jgi:HEAT repeat protein
VESIAKFYNPRARETLLATVSGEHNPAIVADALRGLGAYHQPAVHDTLLKYLASESYRNMLADAAIEAIRAQDDPGFVTPLRENLSGRQNDFTSSGFAQALDTLAYIDRNEKPRDDVRNFIAGYLNSKREQISLGAMKALGTLEDQKAVALLQTFASCAKDSPQHQEAEWSLSRLRNANKPNDNLQDLRQELLNLQRENREIRKDLEDLKKRVSAGHSKQQEEKKLTGRLVGTNSALTAPAHSKSSPVNAKSQ